MLDAGNIIAIVVALLGTGGLFWSGLKTYLSLRDYCRDNAAVIKRLQDAEEGCDCQDNQREIERLWESHRDQKDMHDRIIKAESESRSAHQRIDEVRAAVKEAIVEFRDGMEKLKTKIYG